MDEETNNQILSEMAGVEPYTKTNNQLLQIIADIEAGEAGDVQSVNGQTGVVTLSKADVGLTNVDNTSDANKPVSTAQSTALSGKITKGGDAPAGTLTFGTTNGQGIHILINNNPLFRMTSIGNIGINVGSEPSVPFLVGGGLFTQAGSVFAQINPDSGTDLSIGTTSNHPVDLVANGITALTLATDGSVTSPNALHMSNKKVTDVANGTDAQDAVNFQQLATKLTAAQGAAQSDSVAVDVPGLVSDFNALLAKLRTANIIAT